MKKNMLTRIEDGRRSGHGIYQCECGNEKEIKDYNVSSGNTTSCGCMVLEPQGLMKTQQIGFRTNKDDRVVDKDIQDMTEEEILNRYGYIAGIVAKRKYRQISDAAFSEEDILSEAYALILEAARNYNDGRGIKASSYIRMYLDWQVQLIIDREVGAIRMPANVNRAYKKAKQKDLLNQPTDVIAKELNVSRKRAENILLRDHARMARVIGEHDPTDPMIYEPPTLDSYHFRDEWLEGFVRSLSDLEREYLFLRMQDVTLQEIADRHGVTKQAVDYHIKKIRFKYVESKKEAKREEQRRTQDFLNQRNKQARICYV